MNSTKNFFLKNLKTTGTKKSPLYRVKEFQTKWHITSDDFLIQITSRRTVICCHFWYSIHPSITSLIRCKTIFHVCIVEWNAARLSVIAKRCGWPICGNIFTDLFPGQLSNLTEFSWNLLFGSSSIAYSSMSKFNSNALEKDDKRTTWKIWWNFGKKQVNSNLSARSPLWFSRWSGRMFEIRQLCYVNSKKSHTHHSCQSIFV
jgi:hypothetical protein